MNILENLNEPQREAVLTTEGPLLILAGAGSGKTRVLTNRTAYLIDEMGVNPYNILAITFTNKAAGEMRERIDNMVGYGSESIWVSTFHSTCVRILRRYIDRLGYGTNFTIYDTDDQKTLMKDICDRLKIDTKLHKEKTFLAAISSAKDEMIDPITYANRNAGDFTKRMTSQVYAEYQQALKKNNALDFDDLLMLTVELFKVDKEVLAYYQERFRYIMVDEYQDTNTVQFEFVRLLASKYQNLCVVGDDDQSIYKFRGANIYNILNFEKHFPGAKVIKLEQNYRSTQNILDAANAVISNNVGRKEKRLWTDNGQGEKITFRRTDSGNEEAELVSRDIRRLVNEGESSYRDCAVLYRTNAQSRLFEERFIAGNIPYKLIGGTNFYARKEIKDLLAYLKTVENGHDDIAVKRIINVPKRGIGATTISKIDHYAVEHGADFFNAARYAQEIPGLGKAAAKVRPFVELIMEHRRKAENALPSEILKSIIEETGYVDELKAEDTIESQTRIENIDELITKAVDYETGAEQPSLSGFLEEVALVAEVDKLEDDSDYVILMTLHSAKGLEFDNVYLTGMEDGIFPSYMSIMSDNSEAEIEEERRLAYVGITRAKKHLVITAAASRMIRGQTQFNKISRFVREIPSSLISGEVKDRRGYEEEMPFTSSYQKAKQSFRSTTSYGSGAGVGYGGSGYGKGAGNAAGGNPGFGRTFPTGSSAGLADDVFNLDRPTGSWGGSSKKSKPPVYTPVSNQKSFAGKSTSDGNGLGYHEGDRVRHIKFGDGTVKAIIAGGRDYEVTVDFDKAGTKKMFAAFAKLKRI